MQASTVLPFQHFLHLSLSITDWIFSIFPQVSQRDILGWSHPLLQGYTGGSGCEGGVGSHCNMHVQPPVAHPLAGDEDERRADRDQGLSAALQHKGRHCAAKSKIYAPCDLPSVSHSREPRANQCWYDWTAADIIKRAASCQELSPFLWETCIFGWAGGRVGWRRSHTAERGSWEEGLMMPVR